MNTIQRSDYKTASEIFYKLLKSGELKEKKNKDLFLAYINNASVREALECICESSKCSVKVVSDILYLIPNEDNDIIGFDYRKESSLGSSEKEAYLCYLIMTIIFAEFTNEYCPTSYLKVTDILTLVKESLDRASSRSDIEELEDKHAFNITAIKIFWYSKPKWSEDSKTGIKTKSFDYQIGYIRKVITFLSSQELIAYVSDEDKIMPTVRFTNIMNGYFLDEERKALIEKIFLCKGRMDNATI